MLWVYVSIVFPSIDQMAETDGTEPAAVVEPVSVYVPTDPYDKETMKAINNFFKKRTKQPGQYIFSNNGNLEIVEGGKKKKDAAGTIRLKRFVPLDASERTDIEEARKTALIALDEEYEEAFDALRKGWEEYESSGAMRSVLAGNQRLAEIDAKRNLVRTAVRNLISIPNPTTSDIILSDRYEERKMFAPRDPFDREIVRLALYTFKSEVDQGKYVPDELAPDEQVAAEDAAEAATANEMLYRQKLKDGRFARIFYDTDSETNGFLSPMWVVDFTMNVSGETRYSSAIQAYEVERAKELGKDELAKSLLKTRAPRTVRLMTRQVVGHPSDAKALWVKIYTSVYEQHPILKANLLATGSDTLVFADTREGPSSIGLAEKDSAALDPAKWKSENAVGIAQETVRTRLREGTLEEAPEAEEVEAAAITEDEQKKAKVAAIINNRRRG